MRMPDRISKYLAMEMDVSILHSAYSWFSFVEIRDCYFSLMEKKVKHPYEKCDEILRYATKYKRSISESIEIHQLISKL